MPDWDEIFKEKGRIFTEPHPDIPRISKVFDKRGVQRILDLGCGTGRHLVFFAKRGFEMYGFDSSPQAITLSKEWLNKEGIPAKTLVHRMETRFPFEDDFFDAVISIQVIHHNLVDDILTTVNEVERVLKPNGLAFITVPVLSLGPVERERDWELEEIEKGTYIPHRGPEAGIPHHYFTENEIHEVFHSFKILEMYLDDSGHRCFLGLNMGSHN